MEYSYLGKLLKRSSFCATNQMTQGLNCRMKTDSNLFIATDKIKIKFVLSNWAPSNLITFGNRMGGWAHLTKFLCNPTELT
jgi:hypothetical protein